MLSRWLPAAMVFASLAAKDYLDLTWTTNYFGTGDNHWHITFRIHFGAEAKKQR